ncbi:MAG TPA: hypothetical protein VLV81_01545 [Acidimicrobiia bacterium]|nr:hypothetical protein [Acidimicrobiia bacterium]
MVKTGIELLSQQPVTPYRRRVSSFGDVGIGRIEELTRRGKTYLFKIRLSWWRAGEEDSSDDLVDAT